MVAIGNIVIETATGSGTGSLTLTAFPYYRRFSTAFGTGSGNTFYYCIRHRSVDEYEVGIGYMSSASTLVRSSVIESSNSNALVNFSAGDKDCINDIPASLQMAGPAGSDGQIQYNSSGALSASANLTFNGTSLYANLISDGTNTTIDPNNRKLYGADGTTIMMDWSQSTNYNISMNGAPTIVSGTDNFASGYGALANNTGYVNTAIGYQALNSNTDGSNNFAVGYRTLINNIDGTDNNALGTDALYNNTSGSFNFAAGAGALYGNSTGLGNIGIGQGAGYYGSGNYRIAIGHSSDVQDDYSIAIGKDALATALNSVAIGHGVTNTVQHTVNIGTNSSTYLTLISTGIADNTGVLSIAPNNRKLYGSDGTTVALDWSQSGYYNISMNGAGNGGSGQYNFASGYQALYSNTTGYNNIANGNQALYSNTIGTDNIANGYNALYSNTTGFFNIASGTEALFSNTTGFFNIANGYGALYSNTTGSYNIASGTEALFSNTSGSHNIANGTSALTYNTTGSNNIANGLQALFNNTTGDNNIANGTSALYSNTVGTDNIASGFNSLLLNTTGSNNIALGVAAAGTGNYSDRIALGYNSDVQGNYAIAIGSATAATAGDAVSIGHGVTNSVANTVNIGTNSTTYLSLSNTAVALRGRTLEGNTGSGGNLTLSSTSNATKGKIYLGGVGSYFDEANNQLIVTGSATESNTGTTGLYVVRGGSAPTWPNSGTNVAQMGVSDNYGGNTYTGFAILHNTIGLGVSQIFMGTNASPTYNRIESSVTNKSFTFYLNDQASFQMVGAAAATDTKFGWGFGSAYASTDTLKLGQPANGTFKYITLEAGAWGTWNTRMGWSTDSSGSNAEGTFTFSQPIANVDAVEVYRIRSGNFGLGTGATVSAKLHVINTTEQLRVGYDASNYYSTTVSSAGAVTFNAVGASAGFTFSDSITLSGVNIVTDTTTGTKIGTSTSQKIGFYNATPVVQQANASQAAITAVTDANAKSALQAIYDLLKNYGLAPATA